MIPTEAPRSAAARAARWPARPAPITRTSCCGMRRAVYSRGEPGPSGLIHRMDEKVRTHPPDPVLAERGRRQHGVVSRAQLMALGLSRAEIDGRVRRKVLHRVHRGVYAVGHLALTRNGRFMAAVLACGEGAALSHFSAAVLWGILEDRGQAIHVTVEGNRACRGIVVHR